MTEHVNKSHKFPDENLQKPIQKEELSCPYCEKIFMDKEIFSNHIVTHNNIIGNNHKITQHTCKFCYKIFTNR